MIYRGLGLGLLLAAALPVPGCSSRCGRGTVENANGDCEAAPASTFPPCDLDAGATLVGGVCVPSGVGPSFCGPNTTWDPAMGKCVGNQTQNQGCSKSCSAPSSTNFCVTGTIFDFVTPATKIMPSAMSHAQVRIYEPVSFVSGGPTTPPVKTTEVENNGCYLVDGLNPSSFSAAGLVAVAIDDVDASTDDFVLAGVIAPVSPGSNTMTDSFAVKKTDIQSWQTQIGAGMPSGCTGGLLACGVWAGLYLDASGNPIQGVTPTEPGTTINPANVFCFRADRMHLTTQDTTDATGLCIISPDTVGAHSGQCSPSCTCTGGPCTPSFPSQMTGTTTGVVLIQRMQAM